jgi:hypothetical protein
VVPTALALTIVAGVIVVSILASVIVARVEKMKKPK